MSHAQLVGHSQCWWWIGDGEGWLSPEKDVLRDQEEELRIRRSSRTRRGAWRMRLHGWRRWLTHIGSGHLRLPGRGADSGRGRYTLSAACRAQQRGRTNGNGRSSRRHAGRAAFIGRLARQLRSGRSIRDERQYVYHPHSFSHHMLEGEGRVGFYSSVSVGSILAE